MTIFLDASAIVAMIAKEPEAGSFAHYMSVEDERITSPIALWESVRAVARVRGVEITEARELVFDLVHGGSIQVVPIELEDGELAIEAHQRYGRGVHPAALNMGDCFAYASTRRHGAEILFKGNDFIHTDLPDAMLP